MDREAMKRRLIELRMEHGDLDDMIGRSGPAMDELRLRRMKKRKLALKDEIAKLESALVPDLIA